VHEIEQISHVFPGLRKYMFLMKHCLYTLQIKSFGSVRLF